MITTNPANSTRQPIKTFAYYLSPKISDSATARMDIEMCCSFVLNNPEAPGIAEA